MSILENKDSVRNNDNELDYMVGYYEVKESDFFPPQDNRYYVSGIEDIDGGDNFTEYAEWFWETYEDYLFDCNN